MTAGPDHHVVRPATDGGDAFALVVQLNRMDPTFIRSAGFFLVVDVQRIKNAGLRIEAKPAFEHR